MALVAIGSFDHNVKSAIKVISPKVKNSSHPGVSRPYETSVLTIPEVALSGVSSPFADVQLTSSRPSDCLAPYVEASPAGIANYLQESTSLVLKRL
jgi:hypothetical protein